MASHPSFFPPRRDALRVGHQRQCLTGGGKITEIMDPTYAQLTGRRAWLVPAFSVWGELAAETIDAVATEVDDTSTRVVFLRFPVGGAPQDVGFASLTDHRGNALPAQIDHPVVVPIPKSGVGVAVIGAPSNAGFRVGKTQAVPEDAIIDLWIVEAGT